MRCQLHLDVEAASICVSCGRALCRDCQQTTRDERMICGLPQCEEFVKRQAAVQFATRQTCANNAEAQLLMANLCRALALVMFLLGAGLVIVSVLAAGVGWRWGFPGSDFVPILLVMLGSIFLLLGAILHRLPAKLIAQARNWEDISREFEKSADSQPDDSTGPTSMAQASTNELEQQPQEDQPTGAKNRSQSEHAPGTLQS
jgi:hypothetical protein